jgi:hypothetical protein
MGAKNVVSDLGDCQPTGLERSALAPAREAPRYPRSRGVASPGAAPERASAVRLLPLPARRLRLYLPCGTTALRRSATTLNTDPGHARHG